MRSSLATSTFLLIYSILYVFAKNTLHKKIKFTHNNREKKVITKLNYVEHIILALFLAFGLDYFIFKLEIIEKIIYYVLVGFSSLVPDIDTPKSKIGRIIPISYIIYKLAGHRTLTHSFITILVVSALASFIYGFNIIIFSIALGCIFHILGDLLTPSGVAIFYPLTKHRYGNKKRS